MSIDYTAAQIEQAISRAMSNGNMQAVVDLLHVLAVKDPRRAQVYLDVFDLAKAIRA